jgi:hypothetical protein
MLIKRRKRLIVSISDVHRLPEKWLPVSIAPADTDLEVGVLDTRGDVVALVFPVHKKGTYWIDAVSKKPVEIWPTHWRTWNEGR